MSSQAFDAADQMHSAAIHLLRRAGREDVKTGTSAARLSALSVLVFAGPKTVSELAGWERVKVPTMSRLVASMEADGLVRKAPNGLDARSVVLHPTSKGRRVLERARELRLSTLASLFAGASPAELATVREAAAIVDRLVL
jgi:DNA-binding MarR family transcriptional regulator